MGADPRRADAPDCAIVGSTCGDEAQQAYVCARIAERLCALEERGALRAGSRILVIPCANPLSMNVSSRFLPADGTDVNRSFPGSARGTTAERVAAGIFEAVRGSSLGLQLASFNQQGDFLPHVRVTRAGEPSEASLGMAPDFRLPCVLSRDPTPFDAGTLNCGWQQWGTHAFSLYSMTTDRIDRDSAELAARAALRFMAARGLLGVRVGGGTASVRVDESELVDVRTEGAAGFLDGHVRPGERVERGQELAVVLDALDAHVRERLVLPVDGRVFFRRVKALVQQRMVAYRIIADA